MFLDVQTATELAVWYPNDRSLVRDIGRTGGGLEDPTLALGTKFRPDCARNVPSGSDRA
jgi:hypothetical protein